LGWDINVLKDKLFFCIPISFDSACIDEKYVISNPDKIEDFNKAIIDMIKELPPSTIVFGSLSTIWTCAVKKKPFEAVRTWNKMAMVYDHVIVYKFHSLALF